MKDLFDQMLSLYEKGKISRRDFVQSMTVVAAAPAIAEIPQPIFRGKTLNHVTLAVADVNKSGDFYQQLLDLPLLSREPDYSSLDLGDSFLGLYKYDSPGRIDHFCIGIENFDAKNAFAKLKKELPSSNPSIENENEVYLLDPDNIRVQLGAVKYKH